MIRRMTAVFSVAAALLMGPGVAAAQQSTSAEGEFRWVYEMFDDEMRTNIVFMVQSQPPATAPTRPVEVWVWRFHRSPVDTQVFGSTDVTASRDRIDCEAGTFAILRHEDFLGDVFLGGFEGPAVALPSSPGTASSEIVRVACEPGYGDALLTFSDLGAARAWARARFERSNP